MNEQFLLMLMSMLGADSVVSVNPPTVRVGGIARPVTETELLAVTKAAGIAKNRDECSNRIFSRYPAGRQLSALAGLYDSANVATMVDWIAANVAAENTAADLIEAATTVQAVEAVSVSWPA